MSDNEVNKPEVDEASTPKVEIKRDAADYRSVYENSANFTGAVYESFKTPLPAYSLSDMVEHVAKWPRNELSDARLEELTMFATPEDLGTRIVQRDNAIWGQGLPGPNGDMGIRPRNTAKNGALSVLTSLTGGGAQIKMLMPASGFYITFSAPTESEMCDFDFASALDTSIVGMDTTGLLLNASSGVYIRNQVNFALNYAVDCSMVHNRENIRTTVLNRLNERDYGLVLLGPMIAKFLGGFPYTLTCSVDKCDYEEDKRVNLARLVHYDRMALTEKQLTILDTYTESSSMTDAIYKEYHDEFKRVKDSTTTIGTEETGQLILNYYHPNIGRYFNITDNWVRDVEDSNNVIMTTMATEDQRRRHLQTRAETRRLLRYQHLIESIESVAATGERELVTDDKQIEEILRGLCADPTLVKSVESDIHKFIVSSSLTMIGYRAEECPSCHTKPTPGNEFIPMSPDSVFFMLVQLVSETYKALANPDV